MNDLLWVVCWICFEYLKFFGSVNDDDDDDCGGDRFSTHRQRIITWSCHVFTSGHFALAFVKVETT